MNRYFCAVAVAALLSFACVLPFSAATYTKCNWLDNKTSAVTFTFDDGLSNQFTKMVPILDEFNMKATFYIVTDWATRDTLWPRLKEIAANGHEIGSHTLTHPTIAGTRELAESKRIIEEKIGMPCLTVAYPYCNFPSDPDTLRALYISGRVCDGQLVGHYMKDTYNISSIMTGTESGVRTADDIKAKLQTSKSEKKWCVFLIHEIDKGSGYSPTKSAELKTVLRFLKREGGNYWVATFREVSQYISENVATTVTEVAETPDSAVVRLTNNLNDSLYNIPLTIKRSVPDGWTGAVAVQNGDTVKSWISGTTLYFNAVPDAGDVVIRPSGTTGVADISVESANDAVSVSFSNDAVTVRSKVPFSAIGLTDAEGRSVYASAISSTSAVIPLDGDCKGIHILTVSFENGERCIRKLHFSAE